MNGFKQYFVDAEMAYNISEKKLENFRYRRNLYGFCINEGGIDQQSINYAMEINKDICSTFMRQPKSLVGYKDNEAKYLPIDDLDSKHILQLTFLMNNNSMTYNLIVEIGGGFGNMARLSKNIVPYTSWDIIDIPHMSELQRYYLETEIKEVSNFRFLSAYSNNNYSNLPIDLVIGTHSLSEFALDDFLNYFNNVIKYSKYLYLGYQKYAPSTELIQKKLDYLLKNGFVVEKNFDYTEKAGASVSYTLFKNSTLP